MTSLAVFCAIYLLVTTAKSQIVTLEEYNIDKTKISTSGISAGACFATQLHVAESNKIMGIGLVAGVPYYCARGATGTALSCMAYPAVVQPAELVSATRAFEADGEIDPVINLANDKVYIFAGSADTVVVPEIGPTVEEYYLAFTSQENIYTKFDIAAEHGWPTTNRVLVQCNDQNSQNYINDCDYESAYDMLSYIYDGGLLEAHVDTELAGEFLEFDQSEFIASQPGSISLDRSGYIYVPSGCVDKSQVCRLHIAFHGCLMGKYRIGTDFHDFSGLSHVGELNNIIILYPQAVSSLSLPSNPNGCFDWWGYNDDFSNADRYVKKTAPQIVAVMGMVDRLAGF